MPKPNKQPKESEQDQVNKLIDWYEKNKPEAGKTILVSIPRKKLVKFADSKVDEDHFRYRGRVLHTTFPAASE